MERWKIYEIPVVTSGHLLKLTAVSQGTAGPVKVNDDEMSRLLQYFFVPTKDDLKNLTFESNETHPAAAVYRLLLDLIELE